jgi:alkanesulfonate monooxygenase SsuD/methylene tetrahydromethanopterin reductase-like flavin-dependent oxidoreductase (luciferase family)
MRNVSLSIVDIHWPPDTLQLITPLAEAGYRRCWLTEHHSSRQSASPAVLAAAVASTHTTIRVGTAAILLAFTSPVKVVEDFRLLELLFPGRIDLGVASGGSRRHMRGHLLDGREEPDWPAFSGKVRKLAALLAGDAIDGLDGAEVGPACAGMPPARLWVCGLGVQTGELAGSVGARFAFSEHMRLNLPTANGDGRRSIDMYRDTFAGVAAKREVSVACYGVCAESSCHARALWTHHCSSRGKDLRPTFVGAPAECVDQLAAVADAYEPDELALCTLSEDPSVRLESYGLLAEALRVS